MSPCPICSAADAQALRAANGYSRYHCQSCDVIFSDPMAHPGVAWYQQSPVYAERRERTTPIPMTVIRRDWRFRTFLDLRLHPGGQLLDVGAGSGIFMKLATRQGYRASGLESDPLATRTAQELYGVAGIQTVAVEDFLARERSAQYEIITLFDVLEHLEKPLHVLSELSKYLVEGGVVVVTVPGHRRVPQWFAPATDLPPHHLTLWSQQAVTRCFENAGLHVIDVRRSPLWSGDVLNYAFHRFAAYRRIDIIGKALRASGLFVIMPLAARALSILPRAGGFTVLGVGQR